MKSSNSLCQIIVLPFCFLLLTACGGGGGTTQAPLLNNYAIKGDPEILVAGAQFDNSSLLNADNIDKLADYALYGVETFAEKGEIKDSKNYEEMVNKNTPKDDSEEKIVYKLIVTQQDRNNFKVSVDKAQIDLIFTDEGEGSLQLTAVQVGSESMKLKSRHWSQSKNGNFMSILFSYNDPAKSGKGLGAIYFQKLTLAQKIPIYDKIYQFMGGPGVGLRWKEKTVNIDMCGNQKDFEKAKAGVNIWAAALEKRLEVKFKKAATYAPFSDLNQRCIYVVDLYDATAEYKDGYMLGVTRLVMDNNSGEFVDGDIFIYGKAFERLADSAKTAYGDSVGNQLVDQQRASTHTHELGHFLGLHHKFDGTKSIMSYDRDSTNRLTDYDRKAIQTLYPLPAKK